MKKKIVFILPALVFSSLVVSFFWSKPTAFWLAIFLIWLFLFLAFYYLFFSRFDESFLFLGQLFFLILGISLSPIFFSQDILFFPFLAGLCLILYFYLKDIYRLLYQPRFYRPYALEVTALPLNFVIIFLLVVEAEMLVFVYHLPRLIALLALFLSFFWLSFYYFAIQKEKKIFLPTFVTALLLIEAYLVFSFLPLSGHLNGLILAVIFVIIIKIWQQKEPRFI
jgi:hypothetical protein